MAGRYSLFFFPLIDPFSAALSLISFHIHLIMNMWTVPKTKMKAEIL